MKILLILCGILFFFGTIGGVQAVPIQVGEASPGWIGTAGGSPPNNVSDYDYTLVNEIITEWNEFYAPSELEELVDNSYDYVNGPNMTWTENYQYLTVKYAGYVDLFYIEGLTSFNWTGSRIGVQQGFSHARLWNPTSIPEPANMLLIGTGLIGLAGLGRKKFFKSNT